MPNTYPLLFSFRDVVAGAGFYAGVAIDGRAILVTDDEGAWFYGVEPGGVAGHGATAQEAHQDFRVGYRSVLADFGDEAEDFHAFRAMVEDFLSTINRPNEARWEESVRLVRAGNVKLDWLPKRAAEMKRHREIVELTEENRTARINDPAAQGLIQSLAA